MVKEKMIRLRVAWRAFWCILRQKRHIYSDDRVRSFYGTGCQVQNSFDQITDLYHNEIGQQAVLEDYKKILQQ